MKRLACEMCGSTDFEKQEGFLVCQSCGLKYSVEEARKIMVEGTVEVQGTVKVDSSEELKNLYQAARNAREASDDATAIRHYESISAKDPNSWEALFYLSVLKTNSIKNGEIATAAIRVSNCLDRVFQLIKGNVANEAERKAAVKEVAEKCYQIAVWLTSASHNFYKTVTKGNGLMALTGVTGLISSLGNTGSALSENQNRCFNIGNLMCICGNGIEAYFDMTDDKYKSYVIWCWKRMLGLNDDYKKMHGSDIFSKESLSAYRTKISRYDPNYIKEQEERQTVQKTRQKQEAKKRSKKTLLIMALIYVAFVPFVGLLVNAITLFSGTGKPQRTLPKGFYVFSFIFSILVTLFWIVLFATI
ncbi:MAG: TFIIB-type zinc finger domain-containing protein [Clostridia bacterium]|nr:TFIIB-type zinc finger domain-containing protein [Clostridia bacterium]